MKKEYYILVNGSTDYPNSLRGIATVVNKKKDRGYVVCGGMHLRSKHHAMQAMVLADPTLCNCAGCETPTDKIVANIPVTAKELRDPLVRYLDSITPAPPRLMGEGRRIAIVGLNKDLYREYILDGMVWKMTRNYRNESWTIRFKEMV